MIGKLLRCSPTFGVKVFNYCVTVHFLVKVVVCSILFHVLVKSVDYFIPMTKGLGCN